MNWIVRYYIDNVVISHLKIYDRTEKEAENEAIANMDPYCNDWTLTELK